MAVRWYKVFCGYCGEFVMESLGAGPPYDPVACIKCSPSGDRINPANQSALPRSAKRSLPRSRSLSSRRSFRCTPGV